MEAVPKDNGKILVRLSDQDEGQQLRIEVIDNGVGISKEDLTHIFEPFYTTKKSEENTGLGLSVAYRIVVVRHGGEISVDSRLNEGTTFTIDLPVNGPEPPSSEVNALDENSSQEV